MTKRSSVSLGEFALARATLLEPSSLYSYYGILPSSYQPLEEFEHVLIVFWLTGSRLALPIPVRFVQRSVILRQEREFKSLERKSDPIFSIAHIPKESSEMMDTPDILSADESVGP